MDPRYPDDPPARCCGRAETAEQLHAEDCTLEDHDDCDVHRCTCDDDCECPCDECEDARRASAEYERRQCGGRDPDARLEWED